MRDTNTVGDEMTDVRTSSEPQTGAPVAKDDKKKERVASLWSDALSDLRRNPVFLVGAFLVVFLLVLSAVPQWFTDGSPFASDACILQDSLKRPSSGHWFGYDIQGCDIYTRTVWATRNSVTVGIVTTTLVVVVGVVLGLVAGWVGGFVDSILSRFTEIFFAIPLLLGGMLIMSGLGKGNAWTVSIVLATLGWPQIFRIMRSSVLQNKNNDYVVAARALGAGSLRITLRHILPNAIAPVIVVGAISLGVYIGAEAALSYLGIGVQPPEISWGLMVSDASVRWLQAPHVLLFPAAALSITVLAFIMVGDAVRDALDPKLR
ncbi:MULTISPECIES: ABC transporter permease [unclassified Streptomyces]|uniref:ABC transporter permease n=1 Tax=unclassified Streptomyces TaxID=2593676 RepID=UPI001BEB3034|nr:MULTISPECIES: ABC transporter permease [unclassified Streptomyces]MBT2403028.1 ABC transporter permease [Streptomyces sp. ISL-21]MBT2456537.1 ABC transporter permease [Streptomyces sp. ISL-86]MBT2609681.1 ABC transporter permease [Streptomyces sp. ISL-87]